jgi:predicted CoA-binding protein
MNVKDTEFKDLLKKYKKITVYGLSADTSKPSHQIPLYLRDNKYDVVGISPRGGDIAGFSIYTSIADVPAEHRKFIDVFRRSENIPEVIDEAIAAGGVEVIWLQLGITNPEAEKKAEVAAIRVVSNRCILIEHQKYLK